MTDKLNLIETIAKEDKFSTFSRVLGTSGANAVFSGEGPFTVFVPTNDAFGKIPDKRMNELLNEPDQVQLKALLMYHILPEKVMASSLPSKMTRKAWTGEDVAFSDSNGLKVNGVGVQARNIEAINGVIHQIDTVLTPPPAAVAAAASNATTLPMGMQAPAPVFTPSIHAATVTTGPLSIPAHTIPTVAAAIAEVAPVSVTAKSIL